MPKHLNLIDLIRFNVQCIYEYIRITHTFTAKIWFTKVPYYWLSKSKFHVNRQIVKLFGDKSTQ